MPLRLALMVAVGALLALGACSSDTKTVTAPAPPAPMPDPDPDPDPDPAPDPAAVTLPAAAASTFTMGRTSFTIAEDSTTRDQSGNRYVDRGGYRFVCEGAAVCTFVVTNDGEGAPTVEVTAGTAQPGEVPLVVSQASGPQRLLRPAPGSDDERQQIRITAGRSVTQNLVVMSCPAGGADCVVVIEIRTRGPAGSETTDRDIVATGGVTFASEIPAGYAGLAYRALAAGTGDPMSLSGSLDGDQFARLLTGNGWTAAYFRTAATEDADNDGLENDAPIRTEWGNVNDIDQTVAPSFEIVPESKVNRFLGFAEDTEAEDRAKTYGATPVGRRLGVVVTASYDAANYDATDMNDGDGDADTPDVANGAAADRGMFWAGTRMVPAGVGLPADKPEGATEFRYADADSRSSADRWTMGFDRSFALGASTAGVSSDDGTLNLQLFTNYDTGETTAASTATLAVEDVPDIDANTKGRVLIAPTGGEVPDTAPETATVSGAAGSETFGTYNGVPGQFTCANTGGLCTVELKDDGTQEVKGGVITFTPTTGAQVGADDTDWLAFGSWTVEMNNGNTVVGAFHNGGQILSVTGGIVTAVGNAEYNGIVRGRYAEYDDGDREAGTFSATVQLDMAFGDNTAEGTYSGKMEDFSTTASGSSTAESRANWELTFMDGGGTQTTRNIGTGEHASVTLRGKYGSGADDTLAGFGRMSYYGNWDADDAIQQPKGLAGIFAVDGSDDDYSLGMIGGFGATR